MRKNRILLGFFLLFSSACAGKSAPSATPSVSGPEILAEALSSPVALAVDAPNTFFVGHTEPEGTWGVTMVHGARSEKLVSGESALTALAYDPRYGRLIWGGKDSVRMVRVGSFLGLKEAKRSAEPPREYPIASAGEIGSIAYSVMNARVYLSSAGVRKVFSLDPKRGTVEEILNPDSFDRAGLGEPHYLLPSTDGVKLNLVTWKSAGEPPASTSAISIYDLKRKEWKVVAELPGLELTGLEFYRSHLVSADRATGKLYAVNAKSGEVKTPPLPSEWTGPIAAFSTDLGRAVFLLPEAGESKGRLLRMKLELKE